jgi:monosaccharide-transporting ATPase
MPATAEPEGYTAEKAKGNLRQIAAKSQWRCDFVIGLLDAQQSPSTLAQIRALQ